MSSSANPVVAQHPSLDDRSLEDLIRDGRAEAVDAVWSRLYPLVTRIARATARWAGVDDPVDFAQEVAADAFVKALVALPTARDLRSAEALVRTIVRTTAVDHLRRENVRRRRLQFLDDPSIGAVEPVNPDLSPEQRLLEASRSCDSRFAAVRAAFARLRQRHPRSARVVYMRDVEGIGVREIATAESTNSVNVHQMLSRGRAVLRELFHEAMVL